MKNTVFLILGIMSATSVFAWGKSAHLVIGQLAEQYLTPATRAEVAKILGKESLGDAGIWLDAVMNDKKYRNQDNWHYYYKDKDFEDNAVAKLNEFSKVLGDASVPAADKLLPMRALIHITGDIHNPVHCGYFKDHGGHKVKVTWIESGEKSELHKVWDSDLLLMSDKSVNDYVSKLQGTIASDKKTAWSTSDFNQWVSESQSFLDQAYDFKENSLSKAYYEKNIVVVDERLAMAAVRLAHVLNSIFDPK